MKILSTIIFLLPFFIFAQSRYWVATTPANWSSNSWSSTSGGAPDGGGAPTGSQTAIFDASGKGNCLVDVAVSLGNVQVKTGYTGTIDLNGFAFNITGSSVSYFRDGTINDTPGTSSLAFNTTGSAEFYGTTFNTKITGVANRIRFSGGTFNALVDMEANSSGSTNGEGGCTFNGDLKIKNSGTGYFLMGYTNPDIFNGNVEFINTSTSRIRISYNAAGTQFNGNLTVNSTTSGGGIWFGENGGTTQLSGTLNVGSTGVTAGEIRLKNFTHTNASGVSLTTTGTSLLRIQTGSSFAGNVSFTSPRIIVEGSTFNGTSYFEKTGSGSESSAGGNTFVGNVIFKNSGSGYLSLTNSLADNFNADVSVINTGSSYIYFPAGATATISGNLTATNSSSNSSYIYIANNSTSSLSVGGNAIIVNSGGSGTVQRVVLGAEGDVSITGNLTIQNALSGSSSSVVIVANGSNSVVTINGITDVTNSGSANIDRVYLGNQGDVTFNGDLILKNNSSANNSEISCNRSPSSSNTYNGNIVLESTVNNCDGIRFGEYQGVGTLASTKTVTIGAGGYVSGELRFRNFTQQGNTAQNLTLTGTSNFIIYDSDWGGDINFSSPRISSRGTTYRGITTLSKTGSLNDYSYGGNTFMGDLTINNSGSAYFLFGGSFPDDFQGNVTINNTGSEDVYLAYGSLGNTISGDLTISNATSGNSTSEIILAYNSLSSLSIGGNVAVNNTSSCTNSYVNIGRGGKITSIGGNVSIANNASGGNTAAVYIASYDTVRILGDLTVDNIGAANNNYSYFSVASTAYLSVGGNSSFNNAASGNYSRMYIGDNGDIDFLGTVYAKTNSSVYSDIYFHRTGNSHVNFSDNIVLESLHANTRGIYFGSSSGTGTLAAGKTVTIGASGFIAGRLQFRNFTQLGNTPQTLVLDASGTGYIELYDSDWGGDINFSAPRITSRGTQYKGTTVLTKVGGIGSDNSIGGNIFYGNLQLNNSGSTSFSFGHTVSDDFRGDVEINNSGTSNTNIAYGSMGNTIAGNLLVNNTASGTSTTSVNVCVSSNSSLSVNGNVTLNNTGSSSQCSISFANSGKIPSVGGNLIVNNNTTGNRGYVYLVSRDTLNLVGDLTITNSGSSSSEEISMAYYSTAYINIGGNTSLVNSSSASNSSLCYLGYSGKIDFNGTVTLKNSSASPNSSIRLGYTSTAHNNFKENIVVETTVVNSDGIQFGEAGGTSTLFATKTVTIGAGGFVAGKLGFRGFTQIGNTAHTLALDASGTALLANYDSDWGGDVNFSAPRISTRGTRYRRTAILSKLGAVSDYSVGGNTFDNSLTLNNGGSAYLLMGGSVADTFNADVTVNNTGTNYLYLAYNSLGNTIAGNLNLNNSPNGGGAANIIVANGSSSSMSIAGDVTIMNNGSSTNSSVYLGANGKISNVGGNIIATNNSTSNSSAIYLASADTLNLVGDLTIKNLGSTNNQYVYVANGTNAYASIGGNTIAQNSGTGVSTSRIYLGASGDVDFGGTLLLSNNSSSGNSHIYLNTNSTSSNTYNDNIVVESYNANSDGILFGANGGNGTLVATKTVTVGANGFSAGQLYFRNFTQQGGTPQIINLDASGTAIFTNYNSDWGGNVHFSGPRMYTRGTMYRGTAYLEKTGSGGDYSAGGNTFVMNTELRNTGTGYFIMGNGNPDIFQGNLLINNNGTTGSSRIYLAYNSIGNSIAGDLTVNNSSTGSNVGVYGAYASTSDLTIDGNTILNNTGNSSSNAFIYFGYAGDVTFNGDLQVINAPTGTTGYVILSSSTSSYVEINGTASVINSNPGTNKRVYLGSSGDITFNGDLSISNQSVATNSQIYCNHSINSTGLYNGDIVVENTNSTGDGVFFGYNGGVGTLASSKTITIGSGGFVGGDLYFRNFTQLGATPQVLQPTGLTILNNRNSVWNGNVDFRSPGHYSIGTVYNGTAFLEKNGTGNNSSTGGNVFNDDVTIKVTNTAYFMLSNGTPNDFNGNVTYVKTGTGAIYPGYNCANTYAGNITVDANSSVRFGAAGNGRTVFDGNSAQSINIVGATPMPEFRDIETQNPNDEITLNTPIKLLVDLDLQQGNIISSTTNLIYMNDNSVVSNVSDNAFVDGPLEKIGNDAFTFPVGKAGVYRPIEISNPSSSSARFRGEFFNTDPNANGYNHQLKDPTLDHISNCEYWILDRISSTSNVNVKLYYKSYTSTNCSGVDNQPELAVARWDGSMWKDHGNGGVGGTISNGWVVTSAPVSSFSPFTLASTTTNNPLPIELLYFEAEENVDVVNLKWETASEIDNDFFTIERSKDGQEFEEIGIVEGAGNSNQNLVYQMVDEQPYEGTSFYRLKQTDYNGEFTYSDIEVVYFSSRSDKLTLYPNPVKDVLAIKGLKNGDVVRIYNSEGKLIYSSVNLISIIDVSAFSKGMYQLVVIHKNGEQEVLRFAK